MVDTEELNSLDECINQSLYSIRSTLLGHPPKKRRKMEQLVPIVFGRMRTRLGNPKPVDIRILLDSGASSSIVRQDLVKKLRLQKDSSTVWNTAAGPFTTSATTKIHLKLPEFHDSKLIEYNVHVTSQNTNYDLIMGRDLLQELGIKIDFSDNTVTWDHAVIPMKNFDATFEDAYHLVDSACVAEATNRIKEILDAKYQPADLDKIVAECDQLDDAERRSLRLLLEKYKSLFDGTVGHWKDEEYDIELQPDAQPYHAKPFPIPKVHEHTLRMEVDRLVEAGVLKQLNHSEWGAPTFIIPKKDHTVRFISDFRELNKRIKRKPFPIPKIQDLLLKLEGFQYATTLDLNMGYYHIELSPFSK